MVTTGEQTPVDLSAAQREVLVAVKRHGESTADELAAALDVSASAVRQHLASLRGAGLVAGTRQRGRPGRPVEAHHATELAEPLFAMPDNELSIEILTHVEAEDPDLVARIFQRRRARLVADVAEELGVGGDEDRVGIVARLLDDRGYMADWEQVGPDHHRINLRSCAIWGLANHFGQACTSELELIRELIPEALIERTTTKTSGAHTCSYDIRVQRQQLTEIDEVSPAR